MDRRIFKKGRLCRLDCDVYPFAAGDVVVVRNTVKDSGGLFSKAKLQLNVERPRNSVVARTNFVNRGSLDSTKVELLFRLCSTTLPDMTPPLSHARWVRISYHPENHRMLYAATLLTEHYNPILSFPNTVHLRDLIDQEREYRGKWDLPLSPDLLPDRIEDIFR